MRNPRKKNQFISIISSSPVFDSYLITNQFQDRKDSPKYSVEAHFMEILLHNLVEVGVMNLERKDIVIREELL
jgi:hypothetical protein